jgi:Flp pilus assembly protein TadG
MTRWKADQDEGSVMLLMIFLALIIAGLITVVTDVSTVFLAQREMQSTADGAALAAAQQADLRAVYTGDLGAQLPLSREQATAAINDYAANQSRIPHECSAATYQVVDGVDSVGNVRSGVQIDGQTVRVELTCKVPLPFISLVASAFTDGVTIRQVAYAQSAVTVLVP